jgi:hypothetical protein
MSLGIDTVEQMSWLVQQAGTRSQNVFKDIFISIFAALVSKSQGVQSSSNLSSHLAKSSSVFHLFLTLTR